MFSVPLLLPEIRSVCSMISAPAFRKSRRIAAFVLSIAVVAGMGTPAQAAAATRLASNASTLSSWSSTDSAIKLLTGGTGQQLVISSDSPTDPLTSSDIVNVSSDDSTVVDVTSGDVNDALNATPNGSGNATFTITPLSPGTVHLDFTSGTLADVAVTITVTDPALVASKSDVSLIAGLSTQVVINSADLGLPLNTTVEAVSGDSDVVSVTASADANASGNATFSVVGVTEGTADVTFTLLGYGSVTVSVSVFTSPKIVTDVSSLSLFTGDVSAAVAVSSTEVPFAPGSVVSVTTTDPTVANVTDSLTVGQDGTVSLDVTPLSSGTATLTFSQLNYTDASVELTVTDPALVASVEGSSVSTLSLFAGESATVTIASADLYVSDGVSVDAFSSDSDLASVTESSIADMGVTTFTVHALSEGTATLSFSTLNYGTVTVEITVTTPVLLAHDAEDAPVTSLALRAGLLDGQLLISSSDLSLPQGAAIVAESSATDVATVTGTALVDADGNATFAVTAIGDGTSTLTFTSSGYVTSTVDVTVTTPALTTDATTDITLNPSFADGTIVVSSTDFGLAADTSVTAVSSDESVVTVDASQTATAGGEATFTVHPVAAGEADITFSSANYGDVAVHIFALIPDLASDNDLLDLFVTQTGTVNISSSDLELLGDVTAVSSDNTVATVDEAITPDDGTAMFTVSAVANGSTTLTFSSDHYADVQVTVNVTTPELVADNSSIDVFAGGSSQVVITSSDLGLTGDVTVTSETASDAVATVEATDGDAGTATFLVSGVAPGSTTLTFTADNYQSVSVDVNVAAPALLADNTEVTVLMGDTATVDISSDDLALGSSTVNGVSANPAVVSLDSVSVDASDDFASFTLIGQKPGTTSVTFSTGVYTSVSVAVTVLAPELVADPTSIDVMAGDQATVDISSSELGLGDTQVVTASSDSSDVATVDEATITATGDVATFTINGLTKGRATISFKARGYKTVKVYVNVTLPALTTDTTTVVVPAGGGSTTVDIISNDVALGDGYNVTGTSASPMNVQVGADAASAGDTADVTSALDAATFTIVGMTKGTYKVTFTAENYVPVVVTVIVVAPVLSSDIASVSLFVGDTADVNIGSDDLAIGDGRTVTAVNYKSAVIEFSNDGGDTVSSAGDNATFTIHGLTAGSTRIKFTSDHFKPVFVNVVVLTPSLVAGSSTLSLTAGTTTSIDVSSDDFDLGDGVTVTATSSNTGAATVDESIDSSSDVSSFNVVALAKGVTTLVFHVDGYKDVKVKVAVSAPALTADSTMLDVYALGGVGTVDISSDDLALEDGATVTATSAKPDVATVDESIDASSGLSTFTVTGLVKGTTKITFSSANYKNVVVTVHVIQPALIASRSSIQVLVGGTSTFTVSSEDLAIADGTSLMATSTNASVTLDEPVLESGVATFTVTGASKGKTRITITADNYTKVVVSVSVVTPVLSSDAGSGLTVVVGSNATINVTSTDVPLADDAMITIDGGDDSIATISEPVIADGVATYTVTGVAAGKLKLTFSVDTYASAKVKIKVKAAPLCKPSALGSIKFGDTDAKLHSSALSTITKFANSVVKGNCSSIQLTTYVPVANTQANASAHSKEVTLANKRALAVRDALKAALKKAKAKVTVSYTTITGTVPADVLTGSAAGQSSYRKVDVETLDSVAPMSVLKK